MEKNQPLCEKCGKEKCFDHGKPRSEHLCHAFSGHCHGSCQEPSGKDEDTLQGRGEYFIAQPKVEEKCLCGEWWSSKCPVHPDPTPAAPTPGEDWAREFDEKFGKFNIYACVSGPNHRIDFTQEDLKAFIRDLLSSHASKAREEGRKEGGAYKGKHGRMMYQQGVAEGRKEGAEEQHRKDVEAVGAINDFSHKLPHGQVYGLEVTDGKDAIKGWKKCREEALSALSQTNPKKE